MVAFAAKKRGGKTHVAAQKRPAAKTGKQPADASIALTPMKRPAAHRDTATGTKKAKPAPEHSGAAKKTRCPSERVLRGEESAPPTQYNGGTIYVSPKKDCFRVMRIAGDYYSERCPSYRMGAQAAWQQALRIIDEERALERKR